MPKKNKNKLHSNLCRSRTEFLITKSLTFTIHHAESIENLNVIHSNVSPALSIHQTFDHHLEKTHSDLLANFS